MKKDNCFIYLRDKNIEKVVIEFCLKKRNIKIQSFEYFDVAEKSQFQYIEKEVEDFLKQPLIEFSSDFTDLQLVYGAITWSIHDEKAIIEIDKKRSQGLH